MILFMIDFECCQSVLELFERDVSLSRLQQNHLHAKSHQHQVARQTLEQFLLSFDLELVVHQELLLCFNYYDPISFTTLVRFMKCSKKVNHTFNLLASVSS